MLIDNIKDEAVDGWRYLTADVRFDKEPDRVENFWIRRSNPELPFQRPGDLLFVAFLLPSMARAEPLRISVPVSEDLVAAELERIVPLMREWFPRLATPLLECDLSEADITANDTTGSLFSGGVDSWFTLLRQHQSIDALVHFQGFEIDMQHTAAWEASHKLVKIVADRFDKQVLTLATNLTTLIRNTVEVQPNQPWPFFRMKLYQGHGGVARALALRGLLGRMFIPGSYLRDEVQCPSSPGIENAMSTHSFALTLDGIDATRIEKIDWLLEQHPEFINQLRVCINDNPPKVAPLNCGDCQKCIRTAIELRVCGKADYNDIFSARINLKQIRLQRFFGDPAIWQPLADRADRIGDWQARDAALMVMGKKGQLKRRLLRLPNTARRLKKLLFQ